MNTKIRIATQITVNKQRYLLDRNTAGDFLAHTIRTWRPANVSFLAIGGMVAASAVLSMKAEDPASGNSAPRSSAKTDVGKALYAQTCAACHQPDGRGWSGAPPLAGSDWIQGVGPNRLIRIVQDGLTGPIKVKGTKFDLSEPAWKNVLNDEQITAVLTYIRTNKQWGHTEAPVSAAQVKAIREKTRSRDSQWTAAELLAIPHGGAPGK